MNGKSAFPGCCAALGTALRAAGSGALLIRGPCLAPGPGSAVHREERCTASGTRTLLRRHLVPREFGLVELELLGDRLGDARARAEPLVISFHCRPFCQFD